MKLIIKTIDQLPHYREMSVCPVGSSHLDAYLGGGLPRGSLIQLAGEAGAGKSQFCMQTAAKLRSGGDMGTCAFIASDKSSFIPERFLEMARAMGSSKSPSELMSNVFVMRRANRESLITALNSCLSWKELSLLCVEGLDSIIPDFTEEKGSRRRFYLHGTAVLLNKIAAKFNASVVVVNRFTTLGFLNNVGTVGPSLGISWKMYCSYRLWIEVIDGETRRRRLVLKKWPVPRRKPLSFKITAAGISPIL